MQGELRDVLVCHCEECRRWSGHVAACTAARRDDLVILEHGALRWAPSPRSDEHARHGFCGECGSNLFWDAPARDTVSITAGTLDGPTGLRTAGHWYVSQAGDYYEVPADGLPRHDRGGDGDYTGSHPAP